jgi:outer membrane usher protein
MIKAPRWVLIAVFTSRLAHAQNEQFTFVTLKVNNTNQGDALIVITGNDILLQKNDFGKLEMNIAPPPEIDIAGQKYISLNALSKILKYRFDESKILLVVTIEPNYLPTTNIQSAGRNRPKDIEYSSSNSFYTNYAIAWRDEQNYSVFNEGAINIRGNFLYSSWLTTNAQSSRGLTNFNIDDPKRLTRWVLGDQFATSGFLGGSALIGGIGFSRNFNLDPYFVQVPSIVGVSSVAFTPSTVRVYANNQLILTRPVSPGPFNVNDIYASAGAGNVRVVVQDALGNEHQVSSPYYIATQGLKPGIADYNLHLGFIRKDYGTNSFSYEPLPSFVGRYRYGLTRWLTLETRAEGDATRKLSNVGSNITAGSPIGSFQLGLAGSFEDPSFGYAASLGYSYISRQFGVGTSVTTFSNQFANLSLKSAAVRPITTVGLTAGLPIIASLTASFSADLQIYERYPINVRGFINLSSNLFSQLSLVGNFGVSKQGSLPVSYESQLGLVYSFGNNTTAYTSISQFNNDVSGNLSATKPLPVGTGLGYNARLSVGNKQHDGFFSGQLQTEYGRYQADYSGDFVDRNNFSLNAAGGLLYIGKHVYLSRPVDQSFALVRVPEVPKLAVYVNNQAIGETDNDGYVLLPKLQPYYGNRISIHPDELPINVQVQNIEYTIAPPFQGGTVVQFKTYSVVFVTGRVQIRDNGKMHSPTYGNLVLNIPNGMSPLGEQGEFYIENAPPGIYDARVISEGSECSFKIKIPQSTEQQVDLGVLTCEKTKE